MEYNDEQQRAIEYLSDIKRRVVAVTGPAGSGKTTLLRTAVEALRRTGRTVCIAAPTGRAARRISEATGLPAVTIHKLLKYGKPDIDPDSGVPTSTTSPSYGHIYTDVGLVHKPLPYDDVFVDEYAMVSEELHRNLRDALPVTGRMCVFGDDAQLGPIEEYKMLDGEGNLMVTPFQKLLKLPSAVTLTKVHRQEAESGVLFNAQRIRKGFAPVRKPDFTLDISDYPIKAMEEHIREGTYDFSSLSANIISPTNFGPLGTKALNTIVQSYYRSNNEVVPLPRNNWDRKYPVAIGVGDKVICTENSYDLRDFFERFTQFDGDEPVWSSYIPTPDNCIMLNGEIGIVVEILPDGGIDIDFGDRIVQVPAEYREYHTRYHKVYMADARKRIDLAYVVTTHKMQGSEVEHVCYIMHSSISYGLNRNNYYTAVTRARRSVHVISDSSSLHRAARLTAVEKAINRAKAKRPTLKFGDM